MSGPGGRRTSRSTRAPSRASCRHVAVVVEGTLHVALDDGSARDYTAGDVMLLPPGHDAWTVGDVPARFVEFSRGNDYYSARRRYSFSTGA